MSIFLMLFVLGLGDVESLSRSLSESLFSEIRTTEPEPTDHTDMWTMAPRLDYVLTPDADNNTWTTNVQFHWYK